MTVPFSDPRREIHALAHSCMPTGHNRLASALALLLVGVWLIVTLGLTFEAVAAVKPPYYGVFTALVFLLVGRLWGIERELMDAAVSSLPFNVTLKDDEAGSNDD